METETQGQTNANNVKIAAVIADGDDNGLTELVIRKKGQTRGKGTAKQKYGNDLVRVTLKTAFNYLEVVSESLFQLRAISPEDIVVSAADKGLLTKEGKPLTTKDAKAGIQEVKESLRQSQEGTNKATTSGYFDPLQVDGENIPGAKTYKGPKPGQRNLVNSPLPGTIYLQGLKVTEQVIEEAEHGPLPPSKSKGIPLAKRLVRNRLWIGRYVSYVLSPDNKFILRLQGTTPVHSTGDHTIRFRDASVEDVFGIIEGTDD